MDIRIKKVSVENVAPILLELDNKIYVKSYHRKTKDLETLKSDYKKSSILMVYDKEKPIGFMAFEKKGNFTEIYACGFLNEYQNKGIGSLLMQNFLKEVGNKKIQLLTNPKNSPAIIFYLKHGFVISGWKEDYYKNGQPRVLLVKSI